MGKSYEGAAFVESLLTGYFGDFSFSGAIENEPSGFTSIFVLVITSIVVALISSALVVVSLELVIVIAMVLTIVVVMGVMALALDAIAGWFWLKSLFLWE